MNKEKLNDLISTLTVVGLIILFGFMCYLLINDTKEIERLNNVVDELNNSLQDLSGYTELFPNYCIKCYCKDICLEATQ